MGHPIVYCSGCQSRILGAELEQGKAFSFGNRFCCKACVDPLLATLPAEERDQLLAAVRGASATRRNTSTRIPVVRELPSSSTRLRTLAAGGPGGGTTRRRAADGRKGPALWIGLALAAAGVVALALFALSGRPPAAPEKPEASRPSATPPAPSPSGDASVLAARDYARLNPQDLDGQIQRWQQAVFACENTLAVEQAKRGLADALARRKEAVGAQLLELDRQLKPLLEKEGFGGALAFLDGARRRFDVPEWPLEIEKRVREIRAALDARVAQVREEARQAREKKDAARLKAIADRVAAWGVSDQTAALQELFTLAPETPPPPPPPEPPKGAAALAAWEKAMGLAARRDYAGASTALGGADPALRAELADDHDALKRAGQVAEEAREIVARWPKGQKQAVDILDPAGKPARIEAPFLRAEGPRLLFSSGEDVLAVEWGELAPATLASLFLARPKRAEGDGRAALVFCLVEGDLEGASRLPLPKIAVAAKYWDWARKAAAARTEGREAEARALFAAADDGFEDPARTVAAVGQFKQLLATFADTAFVARNRASISARAAGGREYFFFPDTIAGSGTFRLVKAAWTVERDDAAGFASNYVEFVFSALPETEYRAWIYAGACCLETFDFGIQATGLRAPDPKNPKETVAADPGAAGHLPSKIPFFLRKSHATHGGPKTASRWDWIPIPLPKSAEAGPRTVRILSGQQGFSVAYAAVPSLPDFAPKLLEIKEREKVRIGRVHPPPTNGLVGHWRFDEGQGTTAADASGRGHHAVLKGAAWTAGRFGGGVRFDGDNGYVELPLTPVLDGLLNGDYTLSAWFKPEGTPAGKDSQNDANYGIVMKQGWHMGLSYGGNQSFFGGHFLANETSVAAGAPAKSSPPGSFSHAVLTFSRKTGQMALYVNGRAAGNGTGAANVNPRDLGPQPWRFGIGGPGLTEWRWAAKGVMDEVRIYDRALTAWEALALAGVRAPPPPPAPAADARPWTPVPLDGWVGPGYRLENGVLSRIGGADDAARSNVDYGDVEMRIRFEHTVSGYLFFAIRQGGEGAYVAGWNRGHLEQMEKKEHELVFVCKGDRVTATLNGQPVELERRGQPRTGALQFNINPGAELRVKSVEVREPK